MHFQEIRRAAAQGTISLPPPMDSEGLEDLAVLKSCLKVIRELSEFRYAFAKDAMAETFAPLMASVEAKNELERQGLKVSLKDYFLSLILKDLENPDIVIIDNYDSFVYNLSHAIKELGAEVTVKRNDQFQLKELEEFDKILLSPGPGIPEEAGLLLDVIRTYAGKKPILGVCLGEQAIGEGYGGKLTNLDEVFHGIQSPVSLTATDYLFEGLPSTVQVGRYHSWVVDQKDFPDCLEVTAVSEEGYIMALRHRTLDVRGVQFHPESVLTPEGKQILGNWIHHQ